MFTQEDTDLAIALAEEERDTCPLCGLPRVWCRDPQAQFGAFEAEEETCFASHALAVHHQAVSENRSEETRVSTRTSVRFAAGREPDPEAGLGITSENDAS